VGEAGAAGPRGVAGWETAQDRHARGDGLHSLFAAHRLPAAPSAPRQLSAALHGLQHLSQGSGRARFSALASESDLGRAAYDVARADGRRGQPLGGGSR